MESLTYEQLKAVAVLRQAEINTDDGMPDDLFYLVSSLVPLPNVDLLVVNQRGQLLLSRRNDPFYEKSWHIPGGCMRFNEDFTQRIQKTAVKELGCTVTFDETPVAVRNVIRGLNRTLSHPRERGHNVAILFRCYLPEDSRIQNGNLSENDNGYLKWFDRIPADFMSIQRVYMDVLSHWT